MHATRRLCISVHLGLKCQIYLPALGERVFIPAFQRADFRTVVSKTFLFLKLHIDCIVFVA